jgi:hypothetical protein
MTNYAAAATNADDTVNALTAAATPAPLLALNMAIALRSILARHRPHAEPYRRPNCVMCGQRWPCDDADTALAVFANSEDGIDD